MRWSCGRATIDLGHRTSQKFVPDALPTARTSVATLSAWKPTRPDTTTAGSITYCRCPLSFTTQPHDRSCYRWSSIGVVISTVFGCWKAGRIMEARDPKDQQVPRVQRRAGALARPALLAPWAWGRPCRSSNVPRRCRGYAIQRSSQQYHVILLVQQVLRRVCHHVPRAM